MEFEKPTTGSPPTNKKEKRQEIIFTFLFEFGWWLPFVIAGTVAIIKYS